MKLQQMEKQKKKLSNKIILNAKQVLYILDSKNKLKQLSRKEVIISKFRVRIKDSNLYKPLENKQLILV